MQSKPTGLSKTLLGGGIFASAELQSVYSTAQADWPYPEHSLGKSSLLQNCSLCILQYKPTGPIQNTPWGSLLFCRIAVCVFYSTSRLALSRTLLGGVFPSAELQSVYSTVQADWPYPEHSLGESSLLQNCSLCILQYKPTGPIQNTPWGSLPFCRIAVSVFYSPSQLALSRTHLGEVFPSAELQSVYSTVQADWPYPEHSLGESSFCRIAVCVFYSPSRLALSRTHLGGVFPSAELQSVYSTSQADWAILDTLCKVLPFYRNVVSAFYRSS